MAMVQERIHREGGGGDERARRDRYLWCGVLSSTYQKFTLIDAGQQDWVAALYYSSSQLKVRR